MQTRIILDTDIGSDVDDLLALALVLKSPELKLDGVTTVYGDAVLRARMAARLLRLAGAADVPIRVGAALPLLGTRQAWMEGHEGQGFLTAEDEETPLPDESAASFIVRTVMANPNQIHLVAVGPLTNVALALLAEPALAHNLAHLTIMGGAVRGPHNLRLPYCEHNMASDPEAAHVVFGSGALITLVPIDVTSRVLIRPHGVARIRAGGSPFHAAVAGQVDAYPRYAARGFTYLNDPLAVAAVIDPTLVRYRSLHVDVEVAGRLTAGMTLVRSPGPLEGALAEDGTVEANAEVALEVDTERFEEFFVTRLAA